MKFERHIRSTAAEVPLKFQSDRTILNTNLAASRLDEILRKDVFSDIETGPTGLLILRLLETRLASQLVSRLVSQSVCLSVSGPVFLSLRLSVSHTFWQCFCHRIVINFLEVITAEKCNFWAKGQALGHRDQIKCCPNLSVVGRYQSNYKIVHKAPTGIYMRCVLVETMKCPCDVVAIY